MAFFQTIFSINPSTPPKSKLCATITDFIKILTTKSESAFHTFRDDVKQFGSHLKKELATASRSIGDINAIGQAIDGLGSSIRTTTAEIIAQGRELILSLDQDREGSRPGPKADSEGPEEAREFAEWKAGFRIEDMRAEIENLYDTNSVVEGLYQALVPDVVDHETFWTRYFYRIHRSNQEAEDARSDPAVVFDEDDAEEDLDLQLRKNEEVENAQSKDENLEMGEELSLKEEEGALSDDEVREFSFGLVDSEDEELDWVEIEDFEE